MLPSTIVGILFVIGWVLLSIKMEIDKRAILIDMCVNNIRLQPEGIEHYRLWIKQYRMLIDPQHAFYNRNLSKPKVMAKVELMIELVRKAEKLNAEGISVTEI